ncbi:helix-turn-helix domain-containing protein [Nitrospinota bacterium]
MIPRPLEEIEQVDLQNLIDTEVREGTTIDYKREISLDTGDEKREFLADVSSFANAAGGDLVIGMDEENGAPSAYPGLDLPDPDSEILRIENLIRSGIAPRLPGIAIKLILLDGGRFVMVIRIGRSWVSPHRVIFRSHDKFYGRNSGGKYLCMANS